MKPPPGMPSVLNICGTRWTIEYVEGKRGRYGSTNARKRRIRIWAGQQADLMRSTLIHEAIHACLALNGISTMDKDFEESICQRLEVPLLSLIRDNKVRW